jgi:uncharacterized protein (TIGR02996 family)
MPTAAELYDAILADPDNLDLRTEYADAIADTDPEHAELIRLQVDRENMGRRAVRPEPEQFDREYDLEQTVGPRISSAVAPLVDAWQLRRGFPEVVKVSAARFLETGREIYRRAPVRHLILTDVVPHLTGLAASPLLGRLTSLDLTGNRIGDAGLQTLLTSPHLGKLRFLSVRRGGIGPQGAEALAAAETVPNLRYLDFGGNGFEITPMPGGQDAIDGQLLDVDYPAFGRMLIEKYGPKPWLSFTSPDPSRELYWRPDYGEV